MSASRHVRRPCGCSAACQQLCGGPGGRGGRGGQLLWANGEHMASSLTGHQLLGGVPQQWQHTGPSDNTNMRVSSHLFASGVTCHVPLRPLSSLSVCGVNSYRGTGAEHAFVRPLRSSRHRLNVSGKQNRAALRLLASAVWRLYVAAPCAQRRRVRAVKRARFTEEILAFKEQMSQMNGWRRSS